MQWNLIFAACGPLALFGLIDALDALGLAVAGLDVLVAACADRDVGQKRLFHPLTVALEGFGWDVHSADNTTS